MIAYLYVLGASRDPNEVECSVPFEIDTDEIFFGPCKKNLRQRLRKQYLEDSDSAEPDEDIYLIGFNGLGSERERRIVWVGRIKRVMTFAGAWDALADERYDALRSNEHGPSPLHLRPLRNAGGELVGYEHRSDLHPKDWVEDFATRDSLKVKIDGDRLLIAPGETAFSAFPRDCCFLLENIFAAAGVGIALDDAIVEVLRDAQPAVKDDVNAVAIFGLQNDGDIEGKQGWWLPLDGVLTARLTELLPDRIEAARTESAKKGRRRRARTVSACSCARTIPSECEEVEDVAPVTVAVRRC